MSGFGWVTLATNDTYSLGALVLAHSLRRVGTIHQLIVMVTPGVTQSMREKLRSVFDLIFEVNILDSKDERNLLLLKRPELGITFTKMHCWRLTQYLKCVFVDADTLVLQNCDELFDRDEFSAAPDVGWPDCFNSGVFVYRPSEETFNSLLAFALERGSFDGGDQGLLNLYFSDWAHQDINKHLPFIYNMCSTACYSYLPAFKQFGENVKIVHFIGNSKPWLQYFNSETLQVSSSPNFEHLQQVFELWWNLFCTHVHTNLQPTMARINTSIASSCTSSSHSFAYFLNESKCEDSLCTEQSCGTDVTDIDIPPWDPWEHYQPVNSVPLEDSHSTDISNLDVNNESNSNFVENNENKIEFSFHESYNYNNTQSYIDNVISNVNIECIECNSQGDSSHNFEQQIEHVRNISLADPLPYTCIYNKTPPVESPPTYQSITPTVLCDAKSASIVTVSTEQSALATASNTVLCDAKSASTVTISTEQNVIATASNTEPRTESNGGLAGAFAQMTLRQPRSSDQTALEDHLRRQGWEAGRIDYLGQDSFENVWKKICETMGTAPKKEQSPPKQAPVESPTLDPTAGPTASSIPGAESVLPPTSTSPAETGTFPTSAAEPAVVSTLTLAAEPAVVSTPTLAAEPAVVSTPAPIAESAPLSSPVEPVTASVASPPIPAVEPSAVSDPVPASTIEPSTPAAESAALPPPVPIADPVPVSAITAEPTTVATPPTESTNVAAPIPIAEPAFTPTSAVEPTGISASVSASTDESTIVSTPAAESAAAAAPIPVAEPATPPSPAAEPAPATAPASATEPIIVSTPGTEPSIAPTPVTAPIPATEPAAALIRAVSASTPAAETAAVSTPPPTAESSITSTLAAVSTLAPAPEPAIAPPSATKAAAASVPAPGTEHIATPISEDTSTPAAEPSAPIVVPTSAPVSGLTQETPPATASATVMTSKPADQSSTMPVPPPRKSGKNGAGTKKTSKKK